MTVTTTTYQSGWLAWTGAETAFSPGFAAAAVEDVIVEFRDALGVVTALTRGLHYSVTLAAGSNLITVTPLFFPVDTGAVRVTRATPALQPVNFDNLVGYDAATHTRLHDAAAMRDAEIRGAIAALSAPPLDVAGLVVDAAPDVNDYLTTYDVAAGAARRALISSVFAGAAALYVASLNGQSGAQLLPTLPGGRATLTSGVPLTETDVTNAATVYYTPAAHDLIEIFDSARFVQRTFAELPLTLHSTHYQAAQFDAFVALNAGVPVIGAGPMWSKAATITMTIATPAVVSWAAHGLSVGQPVIFTTTGALPTGVTAGQVYFVIAAGYGANAFQFSATFGGAAVNTSGSQSGTHTGTGAADGARGTGAGTTELEQYKGRLVNKNAITLRNGATTYAIAARQATAVATFRCTAAGRTEDSYARRFLSNIYNADVRPMRVLEPTASWTCAAGAVRVANNNVANVLEWVHAVAGRVAEANVMTVGAANAGVFPSVYVGLDGVTLAAVGSRYRFPTTNAANDIGVDADWRGHAGIGRHYAAWLEQATGGTVTYRGNSQYGISGWTLN